MGSGASSETLPLKARLSLIAGKLRGRGCSNTGRMKAVKELGEIILALPPEEILEQIDLFKVADYALDKWQKSREKSTTDTTGPRLRMTLGHILHHCFKAEDNVQKFLLKKKATVMSEAAGGGRDELYDSDFTEMLNASKKFSIGMDSILAILDPGKDPYLDLDSLRAAIYGVNTLQRVILFAPSGVSFPIAGIIGAASRAWKLASLCRERASNGTWADAKMAFVLVDLFLGSFCELVRRLMARHGSRNNSLLQDQFRTSGFLKTMISEMKSINSSPAKASIGCLFHSIGLLIVRNKSSQEMALPLIPIALAYNAMQAPPSMEAHRYVARSLLHVPCFQYIKRYTAARLFLAVLQADELSESVEEKIKESLEGSSPEAASRLRHYFGVFERMVDTCENAAWNTWEESVVLKCMDELSDLISNNSIAMELASLIPLPNPTYIVRTYIANIAEGIMASALYLGQRLAIVSVIARRDFLESDALDSLNDCLLDYDTNIQTLAFRFLHALSSSVGLHQSSPERLQHQQSQNRGRDTTISGKTEKKTASSSSSSSSNPSLPPTSHDYAHDGYYHHHHHNDDGDVFRLFQERVLAVGIIERTIGVLSGGSYFGQKEGEHAHVQLAVDAVNFLSLVLVNSTTCSSSSSSRSRSRSTLMDRAIEKGMIRVLVDLLANLFIISKQGKILIKPAAAQSTSLQGKQQQSFPSRSAIVRPSSARPSSRRRNISSQISYEFKAKEREQEEGEGGGSKLKSGGSRNNSTKGEETRKEKMRRDRGGSLSKAIIALSGNILNLLGNSLYRNERAKIDFIDCKGLDLLVSNLHRVISSSPSNRPRTIRGGSTTTDVQLAEPLLNVIINVIDNNIPAKHAATQAKGFVRTLKTIVERGLEESSDFEGTDTRVIALVWIAISHLAWGSPAVQSSLATRSMIQGLLRDLKHQDEELRYGALTALINLSYECPKVQELAHELALVQTILTELQKNKMSNKVACAAVFSLGNLLQNNTAGTRDFLSAGGAEIMLSQVNDCEDDELSKRIFSFLLGIGVHVAPFLLALATDIKFCCGSEREQRNGIERDESSSLPSLLSSSSLSSSSSSVAIAATTAASTSSSSINMCNDNSDEERQLLFQKVESALALLNGMVCSSEDVRKVVVKARGALQLSTALHSLLLPSSSSSSSSTSTSAATRGRASISAPSSSSALPSSSPLTSSISSSSKMRLAESMLILSGNILTATAVNDLAHVLVAIAFILDEDCDDGDGESLSLKALATEVARLCCRMINRSDSSSGNDDDDAGDGKNTTTNIKPKRRIPDKFSQAATSQFKHVLAQLHQRIHSTEEEGKTTPKPGGSSVQFSDEFMFNSIDLLQTIMDSVNPEVVHREMKPVFKQLADCCSATVADFPSPDMLSMLKHVKAKHQQHLTKNVNK